MYDVEANKNRKFVTPEREVALGNPAYRSYALYLGIVANNLPAGDLVRGNYCRYLRDYLKVTPDEEIEKLLDF